jgi:hypothetical protein
VQEQGHVRRLIAADGEAVFPVGGGGSVFSGGVREASEVERAGGVEPSRRVVVAAWGRVSLAAAACTAALVTRRHASESER